MTFCILCGAHILDSTSSNTGGYCMPCKQKVDAKNDYKIKEEAKRQRLEKFKKKYSGTLRLLVLYVSQLFIIFAFSFQIYEHYPKIQDQSDTQLFSLLLVIVSIIGVIFVTGVIIFYTYKNYFNDKNT